MLLLKNPDVQTAVVKAAASFLSEKSGSKVRIDEVSVGFNGAFLLKNLSVNDYQGNQLLTLEHVAIRLGRISRHTKIIRMHHVEVDGLKFAVRKYHGEPSDNLGHFLKNFSSGKKTDSPTVVKTRIPWTVELDNLRLSNASFIYENEDEKQPGTGIDFNDINLENINLRASGLRMEGDTIWAGIQHLTLIEKSGFDIREFSGNARFSPVDLGLENLKAFANNTMLDLDVRFGYGSLQSFNYFIDSVRTSAHFRDTELQLSDIGYFAPIMFSMNNLVKIKGDVSGTVSSFDGKNLEIKYGQKTVYEGNFRMNGLPDINETFIHANIINFTTSARDVDDFALPAGSGEIQVPALLNKLGMVRITGRFTGFYNDFVSNAQFSSRLGRINTNIKLNTSEDGKNLTYKGLIEATNLNIGKLFDQTQNVGSASFMLNVNGSGISLETLDFTMKGTIRELGIKGYNYQNIVLDGELKNHIFEGNLAIHDQNLDFTFTGLIDLNKSMPRFNFVSHLNHADLYRLNLVKHDSVSVFSSVFNFDFVGNNLDNLTGSIRADSLRYREGAYNYFLKELTLNTFENPETKIRKLTLESDYVDAEFNGKFRFSQIAGSVKKYLSNYSTLLASGINAGTSNIDEQRINFNIHIKNSAPITQLLFPALSIAPDTKIEGNYNSAENLLFVNGHSQLISYLGIKATDWNLSSASESGEFKFAMGFGKILIKDFAESGSRMIGIDSVEIKSTLRADTLFYTLAWNDLSNRQQNIGRVEGFAKFVKGPGMVSRFTQAEILFDSIQWDVKPENLFTVDTSGLYFSDVGFFSGKSGFDIQGAISHRATDSLKMNFQDMSISHLDEFFANQGIDLNGTLNGRAVLVNLFSNLNFLANLTLSNFTFNGGNFETLSLKTTWNNDENALAVLLDVSHKGNLGTSVILAVDGNYYPYSDDQNFDFTAKLNNLSTHVFNPFVDDFVTIAPESLASGSLKLTGSIAKPVVTGNVNLARTQVLIKYLNVLYSAAGSAEFGENFINLNEITIYDKRQKPAKCTGSITHNYFYDFNLDLYIKNENFNALNTTARDNNLFYGTAFMSGEISIKGPFDDIKMDIKAKTEDGTVIFIPISSGVTVSENNFIIFLNNEAVLFKPEESYTVNLKGLSMSFDLEVTPKAEVKIFLPYNMGNISGAGAGNLKLGINPRGDFVINGDYFINKGIFYFNFEKIIGRDFNIREGSSISWSGNPYDAMVDVQASYKINTTLEGLALQTDSTSVRTSVPVECNIFLQNELFNPNIRFTIDFPNAKEDVKQIIYASLDTTDQSAMSQQILSLVVLGNFSNTVSNPSIEATGFKILSKQLSKWLSNISKDVDVGINYKPGTEISEEELQVALRTQLFNDRLSIDGNFGVKGSSTDQNTSNVIGDILVEYKMTEDGRFRVKAFNRTNEYTFLQDNAPYTQGVGVFYKKEFEKVGDLVKPDKEKKKKKLQKKAEKKTEKDSARRK